MHLLIVDDDRISALMLRRTLEKMGHSVVVARNGAEAWRVIRDEGMRLVISDWMMPEMDGLELCRRIRGRSDRLYTYIILLTSRDSREDRLEGLQAGADDFLVKPFDASELVARMNVANRILGMQEELRSHTTQLRAMAAELERQNARLAELAVTDGLTGLRNRRCFFETLDAALSLARRLGQPLSVAMLDVDHFKSYNDSFGHPAGDDALRMVAETLSLGVRCHDLAARYGGEEFIVLLPATAAAPAHALAERLRADIEARTWTSRGITASFGVATLNPGTTDGLSLVDAADAALYRSKQAGRNCVTHHDDLADARSDAIICS
jgi:diguanylate cyclase (GGDEF)-like protein